MEHNTAVYLYGLCAANLSFEEISEHECMDECENFCLLEGSTTFFSQAADGTVIYSSHDSAAFRESGKENISGNSESITSARPCDTQGFEEILIELVKERAPLWNYKDVPVKDRTNAAKNKLWEEIRLAVYPDFESQEYNVKFLKSKWKNLYDTFKSYLSKEKSRSGQAAKNKKPWRYMEQMHFLRDTLDLGFKSTVTNLPSSSANDDLDASANVPSDADDVEPEIKTRIRKVASADMYIERIAEAIATPVPAPIISIKQAPPEEKDEINYFCLALDKKLHNLDKKKSDAAMLEISKVVYDIMCD